MVASAYPIVVLCIPGKCEQSSNPDLNSLTLNVKIRLEQFWGKVTELPRFLFFGIYELVGFLLRDTHFNRRQTEKSLVSAWRKSPFQMSIFLSVVVLNALEPLEVDRLRGDRKPLRLL